MRRRWVEGVPGKIRELVSQLLDVGFVDRGGKGSHRNFVHPKRIKPLTLSGQSGDDARPYQEKLVRQAVEEVKE